MCWCAVKKLLTHSLQIRYVTCDLDLCMTFDLSHFYHTICSESRQPTAVSTCNADDTTVSLVSNDVTLIDQFLRVHCPAAETLRAVGFVRACERLSVCLWVRSQGQYWAGRTPSPNKPPPNMAAANFVVITGEGCALNGTAVAAVLINQ